MEEIIEIILQRNKPTGNWGILLNGVRITCKSGKATWKTKGHAQSALTNHLSSMNLELDYYLKDYGMIRRIEKNVTKELINSGNLTFKEYV